MLSQEVLNKNTELNLKNKLRIIQSCIVNYQKKLSILRKRIDNSKTDYNQSKEIR